MPAWIIQAQRIDDTEDGRISVQLPTFILPECLGLLTEDYARKVAREIIGVPMERVYTVAMPLDDCPY